jgi:Na+/H+ antiporter NhaD/arsenite permease-like protein
MNLHETASSIGLISLFVFTFAYILVASEEFTHIRKSKPVLLASGIIWLLVAELAVHKHGFTKEQIESLIEHDLMEYGELLLFLLVSMTYTNALVERNVFEKVRYSLILWGLNYRQLFWLTGIIAFFLSSIANNLTTAMVMGAVVLACGKDNIEFIKLSFINIVIAANAGGVFSPFGDVTTLMMWQSGKIEFLGFFALFVPAVVNFVVPAIILSFFIPSAYPLVKSEKPVRLKKGAIIITFLFFVTIAISVICEELLYIPPFMGMMMGLSLLMAVSYWLKMTDKEGTEFDIFINIKDSEWDTLLFFYGIIFCIGGLAEIGYLEMASSSIYTNLSTTWANVLIGVLSAIIDNIPVMFSVLEMQPPMELSQWLLVTLTTGVGGSLLSIGSAAGVALMGQSKGIYSFVGHLKWFPVIALGYIASIYAHLLLSK